MQASYCKDRLWCSQFTTVPTTSYVHSFNCTLSGAQLARDQKWTKSYDSRCWAAAALLLGWRPRFDNWCSLLAVHSPKGCPILSSPQGVSELNGRSIQRTSIPLITSALRDLGLISKVNKEMQIHYINKVVWYFSSDCPQRQAVIAGAGEHKKGCINLKALVIQTSSFLHLHRTVFLSPRLFNSKLLLLEGNQNLPIWGSSLLKCLVISRMLQEFQWSWSRTEALEKPVPGWGEVFVITNALVLPCLCVLSMWFNSILQGQVAFECCSASQHQYYYYLYCSNIQMCWTLVRNPEKCLGSSARWVHVPEHSTAEEVTPSAWWLFF